MKVVIIDDESDAVEALKIMLTDFIKNVEILGVAYSALEGIKLINQTDPDIVFLDVEMPYGNGFDLLEGISKTNFELIFTTAYSHYGVNAIKKNAFDYLLKPVDIDELENSVNRVREKREKKIKSVYKKKTDMTKIPVSIKNEYLLLDLEDIHHIKSDGSYSVIHTFDKHYVTAKNLKYYEQLLSGNDFLRVSNSCVVNLDKVVKYIREDGGIVELRNKARIPVSKAKKSALKDFLRI